jgi:hypothetical protein
MKQYQVAETTLLTALADCWPPRFVAHCPEYDGENKTGHQGWDLKTTIHEGALSWEQFPGSIQGEF